jgi:hypothetical protein
MGSCADMGTWGENHRCACVVGKEPRRVGGKLCAWDVGMQLGIRRIKTVKEGQGRKERLRVNVCPQRATLKTEATCSPETSVNFNGPHSVTSQKTEFFTPIRHSGSQFKTSKLKTF